MKKYSKTIAISVVIIVCIIYLISNVTYTSYVSEADGQVDSKVAGWNIKINDQLVLNICLNYGSHAEMVDMTKKLCEKYKNNEIELEDITEDFIQKNMYQDLPPLDFVIRTSGELRLSNFMMYQASYAEFYFPKVYFPDFNNDEFDKAILEFNKRNRRFGGVKK